MEETAFLNINGTRMCNIIPSSVTKMNSEKNSPKEKKEQGRWRARWFLLTLNQPERYEALKRYLVERKTFEYLVTAKETGEKTEHEHLHILVCFTQPCILTTKGLEGAMVAQKRNKNVTWTREGAHDYVTKDCEVIEKIGTWHQQGHANVGQFLKIKDPTELGFRDYRYWKEIQGYRLAMCKAQFYNPDVEIYYIWGDSAVGKSRLVYRKLDEDEMVDRVRHVNGFWEGVSRDTSIKVAWYDDFRDTHMKPDDMISFCDYYRNTLNIKGGEILNHYDKIFITSVRDPYDLWPGMQVTEPRRQWLRRMKIIHLNQLGENPLSETESE